MSKEKNSVEITSVPDLEDTGDIMSELHKMIVEDFPDLFPEIPLTDSGVNEILPLEIPDHGQEEVSPEA
jgi:hypothetical protein